MVSLIKIQMCTPHKHLYIDLYEEGKIKMKVYTLGLFVIHICIQIF